MENRLAASLPSRIPAIDGLRGIAILGVVAVHASVILSGAHIQYLGIDLVKLFIYSGRYGVELFFVLSGLTLSLSFRKHFGRERQPILSYALRRFFRLSPMYYLVLAVTILLSYNNMLESGTVFRRADLRNYLVHLSYFHGLFPQYIRSIVGPFWSLTPEVVFYIFLPAILLILRSPAQRFSFWMFSLFLAYQFRSTWPIFMEPNQTNSIWASLSPPLLFFLFVGGVVLADVISWRQTLPAEGTANYNLIANSLFVGSVFGFFQSYYLDVDFLWTWLMIISFVLAYCLRSTLMEKLLRLYPLQQLGIVSYSVFLVHYMIIDYLNPMLGVYTFSWPLGIRYLFFLGLVLSLSWFLAIVSFRWVERPGIKLGEYLINIITGGRGNRGESLKEWAKDPVTTENTESTEVF